MLKLRQFHIMHAGWLLLVLSLAVMALSGCGPKEQPGDKKEDWKKSTPPPQYHGPGQPGGPSSGPASTPQSNPR